MSKNKKREEVLFAEDVVADVRKDFSERQNMRRPYELSWQLNMNFMMGNQYCQITPRGSIEQEENFTSGRKSRCTTTLRPLWKHVFPG